MILTVDLTAHIVISPESTRQCGHLENSNNSVRIFSREIWQWKTGSIDKIVHVRARQNH